MRECSQVYRLLDGETMQDIAPLSCGTGATRSLADSWETLSGMRPAASEALYCLDHRCLTIGAC